MAKAVIGIVLGCVASVAFGVAIWRLSDPKPAIQRQIEERRGIAQAIVPAGKAAEEPGQPKPRPKPKKSDRDKLECFRAAVADLIKAGAVSAIEVENDDAAITVTAAWSVQNYRLRFDAAARMLILWQKCADDSNASITLLSPGGREVGGVGFTGLWVEKR